MSIKKLIIFAALLLFSCSSAPVASAKGCCSHHGGIVGCSFGKFKCYDGTYSMTCKCGDKK